jgi:putative endonuclease
MIILIMYYTYIIESITSEKLYIGQTNNLTDRIKRHNTNQNKFTKNKGPWKLIYSKEFGSRSEAVKFEMKLKSIKNKSYLLEKLHSF